MIAGFCLLFLLAGVMSQRSPYLSSEPYPGLLNRFKPAASNGSDLTDRFGAPEEFKPSYEGANGTLYDQETVNRVATWPVEKQPFWFKNRKQIAEHTGAIKPNGSASATK